MKPPVMMVVESDEMSMQRTGNLWPQRDRKNFNVSTKKILTVESKSETAISRLSGLKRTQRTSSSSCSVFRCTKLSLFILTPASTASTDSSAISSNCQNLTLLSAPPLAMPRMSGVNAIDQFSPVEIFRNYQKID